eukprot:1152554-Pelagomonas_calceolata.AAC.2
MVLIHANVQDYKYKGRVLGRFWNVHGKKRKALIKVEEQESYYKQKSCMGVTQILHDLINAKDALVVAIWPEACTQAHIWLLD